MKKLSTAAMGLCAILAAGTASASWSDTAVGLTSVEIDAPGGTYVLFTTTPSSKPSVCGSPYGLISVADADEQKALTTLATSAFLAGRTVRVHWTGGCDASGEYAIIDMFAIY